ncbi:hypothetical protein KAR91_26335 [Candidatus Pacearchaeota archaeon]|nr:hypothetical protein [Candidatus Pacearchaeota archaeon]
MIQCDLDSCYREQHIVTTEAEGMRAKWNDKAVMTAINYGLRGGEKRAAKLVAMRAKSSTLFTDRSGTLRRSIRAVKSRYKGGGWLVMAGGRGFWGDAWYAAKVELGWSNASARPFLRGARVASLGRIRLIFTSIFGRGARFRK